MSENRVDDEQRSWDDAEAAALELPGQLRVLQRMVAAAKAQLEQLAAGPLNFDHDLVRPEAEADRAEPHQRETP